MGLYTTAQILYLIFIELNYLEPKFEFKSLLHIPEFSGSHCLKIQGWYLKDWKIDTREKKVCLAYIL